MDSTSTLAMRVEALQKDVAVLLKETEEDNQNIGRLEKQVVELLEKQTLPKLMTPRQVADYVGISEGHFYAWKRAGDVPPAMYWSERTVRYDRDEVIAWAESHKVGGAG